MVIAAVGTVLAAAYLLWLYQRTAFGEPRPGVRRATAAPCHPRRRRRRQPGDDADDDHDDDIHDVTGRVDRLDADADR